MRKKPEIPYRGSFRVKIPPKLYKKIDAYSRTHGKTLNTAIEEAISSYLG
jgi:predicted HicB family RNase H-like nuclease